MSTLQLHSCVLCMLAEHRQRSGHICGGNAAGVSRFPPLSLSPLVSRFSSINGLAPPQRALVCKIKPLPSWRPLRFCSVLPCIMHMFVGICAHSNGWMFLFDLNVYDLTMKRQFCKLSRSLRGPSLEILFFFFLRSGIYLSAISLTLLFV